MKISRLAASGLVVMALVAASWGVALAQSSSVQHEFRICTGDFALCAASTCAPNGQQIIVNQATMTFDECEATCPIFTGPAIADVIGGNMLGNCQPPPTKNGIWSLYQPNSHIPQEINNWKKHGPKAAAPAYTCTGSDVTSSNCFSFACVRSGKIKGVQVATCYCPIQEFDAQPIPIGTQSITQSGQCAVANPSVCTQYPVGAPFQIDDIPPPACFPIPDAALTQ
jgi:hypothetical protein